MSTTTYEKHCSMYQEELQNQFQTLLKEFTFRLREIQYVQLNYDIKWYIMADAHQ